MAGGVPGQKRVVRTDGPHPGLHIGFASAALVVATAVASSWPGSAGMWRLLPAATVVLLTGVFGAAASTVAAVGVGAWLLTVGFLVNQSGVLSWNETSDIYRLAIIAAVAALGLAVGAYRRRIRDARPLIVPLECSLTWSAGRPGINIDSRGGASRWPTWCTWC